MTVSPVQFHPLTVPESSQVDFGQEIVKFDLENLSGKIHLL